MEALQVKSLPADMMHSGLQYEDSFDAVRAASVIVFSSAPNSLPLEAKEASGIFSNSSFQPTVLALSKLFQEAVSRSALSGDSVQKLAKFIARKILAMGSERTWEARLLISFAAEQLQTAKDEDSFEARKLFIEIRNNLSKRHYRALSLVNL